MEVAISLTVGDWRKKDLEIALVKPVNNENKCQSASLIYEV
jgi:hypothetical protein